MESSKGNPGKTRKKNEQLYLYRDELSKHNAQDDWKYFLGDWKAGIYQKTPRILLEFLYGSENIEGLKKEKVKEEIENRNQGQS